MAQRDEVYHKFGPLMLEALFDRMLEEVNELRTALNKPPRPKDAFLGSAHNNLAHLTPYDRITEKENFPP